MNEPESGIIAKLERENTRLRNETAQLRALLLDKFLPLDWEEQFNALVKRDKEYNTLRQPKTVK